jgi:hypothetical protein
VAGSNPHGDVTRNTQYPTEYRTEKFYPAYFGRTRPAPKGLPSTLGYGGASWDVTLRGSDLQGLGAKGAITKSKVTVVRTGFSTHGMVCIIRGNHLVLYVLPRFIMSLEYGPEILAIVRGTPIFFSSDSFTFHAGKIRTPSMGTAPSPCTFLKCHLTLRFSPLAPPSYTLL